MARPNPENSVLGSSTKLTGRITGEGGLRIEGSIEGDLEVTGPVEIADGATVQGDIQAESLDVTGTLWGNSFTQGPILVRAGATVQGEVRGSRVTVEPGSRVEMRLNTEFELDLSPKRRS